MSETPAPEATPDAAQTPEVVTAADGVNTFSKEYVKQLRDEAAGHRTSKTAAVEAAKTELVAAHQAELAQRDVAYTELQNQLGSAWIELEKFHTAVESKVPSDKVKAFVEILRGEDKDSITASAKTSLELFGGFNSKSLAFDPSQGLGGKGEMPLNGDPLLNAVRKVVGA